MGYTYTKLFSGLTESTVWVEPYPTRVLWVSLLSWADQYGRIFGSVPGIARRAGINLDECESALMSFMSPDRHSRTPDNDGMRIEKIDGGWRLLNYLKYKEIRDEEHRREQNRIAQQRHRDRLKQSAENVSKNDDVIKSKQKSAPIEVEVEIEVEALKSKAKSGNEAARRILAFLNEKTGRRYQPVEANLKMIAARLKDGATEAELRQVVAKKCREWSGDEKMAEYLRPATLFNATKFAQYQGELVIPHE